MEYRFYNDDLRQKTISELRKMLDEGKVSSEELVWTYLERIAAEDSDGVGIGSVREFNPDAFAIARERDWERAQGLSRGALHGIPILIMDSIDTGDRMHTSCGLSAFKDHYAEKDAFIVKVLKNAGAIIIGKNNMPDLYGFISTTAPKGYSSLAGRAVKNPFCLERFKAESSISGRAGCEATLDHKDGGNCGATDSCPGGFGRSGCSGCSNYLGCSGCAAAVAADMAAAAVGTDTTGSMSESACLCGVVGYKPTVGLTSRSGILHVLACQDTVIPVTRSVKDAAIMANVLIRRDPEDFDTIRADAFKGVDFTEGLDEASLEGIRIGIISGANYDNPEVEAVMTKAIDAAVDRFKSAGAVIAEVEGLWRRETVQNVGKNVMEDGFKARFSHYLAKQKDLPFNSIDSLIEWNEKHPDTIPYGQDYLIHINNREKPIINAGFIDMRMNDLDLSGGNGIWKIMEEETLDALILSDQAGCLACSAGNPVISLPVGMAENQIPVGINIVGHIMGDAELFNIAAACEKVLAPRPVPSV